MGKRQKLKKLARVELELAEKQAIEARRAERLAPVYAMSRRVALAVVATTVLLYVGVMVNSKLPSILKRLSETSMRSR